MRLKVLHKIIILGCLQLFASFLYGQSVPSGIFYQTVVRDATGIPISNQSISVRFSILESSPSGTLVWQETHLTQTDSRGLVKLIIGSGNTTGAGSTSLFSQINWGAGAYYTKLAVDLLGGSNYTDFGVSQLFSVPYAFYSNISDGLNNFSLNTFSDVDTAGIGPGKILKWNGLFWIPAIDEHSDTVLFSYTSSQSLYTDSSLFAVDGPLIDSVLYSSSSFSSSTTLQANYASNSDSAQISDTAQFALSAATWSRFGNSISSTNSFIGTNDNMLLSIRTNNTSRISINSAGNVSIGTATGSAQLELAGNDGMIIAGTFGVGRAVALGTGSHMTFIPSKGAFRAGGIDDTLLEDSIGNYSAAFGYNNKVGKYSFVSGYNCVGGDYTIAMGRKSQASALGAYPVGSGVALGDSSLSTHKRCVAIGRGNLAALSSTVAIGSYNRATGAIALALGWGCNADGYYSVAMGYNSSTNLKQGSFVYADASSNSITNASANNQFLVRAAGGTVFYSDGNRTSGVSLFPGGGSWSSVSDSTKKENRLKVDYELTLSKISKLKIYTWRYSSQVRSIRHIGPMAQDFYAAFGYGENNTTISSIDADGVILSGIKGLKIRLDEIDRQLTVELSELSTDSFDNLEKRLDLIEATIQSNPTILQK